MEPHFELEYPELSARRYCVAIRHSDNRITFVDPVDVMIAEAFIMKQGELADIVMDYAKNPSFKTIPEDSEFSFKLGEYKNGRAARKKGTLDEFSPIEVAMGLENKLRNIKSKGKHHHKLWWGSPSRVIRKKKIKRHAHSGRITLSATIAGLTDTWYDNISITGSYTNSKFLLNSIRCKCPDNDFTTIKLGYTDVSLLCKHTATMLRFGQLFPDELPGNEKARNFFLPFAPKDNLVVETLLSYYALDKTHAKISTELLKHPNIYHPRLMSMIDSGQADFQVVPNKDYTNVFKQEQANLLSKIRKHLEKNDYRIRGYCKEYPTVALNFEKQTEKATFAARITAHNGPPLVIYRKLLQGEHNHFIEDPIISPWSELYKVQGLKDDKTSRSTSYEVRLPGPVELGWRLPPKIMKDYKAALLTNTGKGKCYSQLKAAESKKRIRKSTRERIAKLLYD